MRIGVGLAATALIGGCGIWYRPVPIPDAIGKERTSLGGDSVNVHRDPRFEVYGPGSQAVFDAYEQLNDTYRAFERYVAAPAPRLAVILHADARGATAPDALNALRARGLHPVEYTRPLRAQMRARLGHEGYGGALWPVGPTTARLLLAAVGVASPSAGIDTASLARFPAWYRAAVMTIVSDGRSWPYDLADAQERRSSLPAVPDFVRMTRPVSTDSILDPYVRADAPTADRLFAAHASAFAQFLLDREGQDVLGRLARGYANGATFEQVAAGFTSVPRDAAGMQTRWLSWLSAQRPAWDARP